MHTIVKDDARLAQMFPDGGEGCVDSVWLGQIDVHIEGAVFALLVLERASSQSDLVTLRPQDVCGAETYVLAGTENEGD